MTRSALSLLTMMIPLAAQPLIEGNPKSPVRVVIYEDLQCSDCAAFRKMMDDQILPKFGKDVAFEHRDLPLAKHAWAKQAAIAARFFGGIRPELAVEYRREVMASMAGITLESFPDHLVSFALKHKVDPEKAKAALNDAQLRAKVEEDVAEGVARGVARTPTVLVNGDPFIETFTFEQISQSIQKHLAAQK